MSFEWGPIMPTRGVNLFDDPRSLRPDECVRALNLVQGKAGVLVKRGGLDRPFTSSDLTDLNAPSAALLSPLPISAYDLVLFAHSSTNAILTGIAFSGAPAPVPVSLPFSHPRPHMVAWAGKVYVLPGPYAIWVAAPTSKVPYYIYDTAAELGAVISTLAFAGTGNANVYPTYAFPYKQRLVLAHFGKGYENTIVFTDNNTADVVGDDVLASNGRAINLVASDDGDEIVGGIEVMLTGMGSPAEAGLLILRRHGEPHLLTGDMDQTTGGTSTLDIKRISIQTGCAGHYTVARTPVGIIWAGRDDVWAFGEGVLPRRLGQKIQSALALTPSNLQYRWTGVYFDGFYRLAVWGEGQGMALTDAPGDQWWLDLGEGLPENWRTAEWWGPQQFLGGAETGVAPRPQTWGMLSENRAGKDARLYYIDRIPNGITVGEYGSDPRDMTATAAYIADADYVDPEVVCELITPDLILKPPHKQVNDGINLVTHPSTNIQLTADFVLDDGEYKYSTTKRQSPEGFLTGTTRLGTGKLFKKSQDISFYPSNRRAALQHRFKLADAAGYAIDTWNNVLVCQIRNEDGDTANYQWLVTLTAGLYTRDTLLAALQTAINATKPAAVDLISTDWTVAAVAGITTFESDLSVVQRIGIGYTAVTPAISGTASTAAQGAASKRLAAYIGMDTSADYQQSVAAAPGVVSFAGREALFKKAVSRLELHSLQANFEVIPREP